MTLLDRLLGRFDCPTPEPPPGYDAELATLRHNVSSAALQVVFASADTARMAVAAAAGQRKTA
jgi:hypothetical protein